MPVSRSTQEISFSETLIGWQRAHGRHALPWQNTRDAYRIWLSEIMLQQTQVTTVIPYFERFVAHFPEISALASAPQQEVMALWSGLGYYSRARNLHRCAQQICALYGGVFPADPVLLATLPGIGRSTAAAIAIFSSGARAAILDGNVKRVLCRVFGIDGYPGTKAVETRLWETAEALLPDSGIEIYTQGLMDLGATVCTRNKPNCPSCPMAGQCVALATGRVIELPQRKPKKTMPEKRLTMLIILDGAEILLLRRPEYGIWGGLWSLPEVESDNPAVVWQAARHFGEVDDCQPLAEFWHVFTHFRLHVAPWLVRIQKRALLAAQQEQIWQRFDQLPHAPLPAPIRKLLSGLSI